MPGGGGPCRRTAAYCSYVTAVRAFNARPMSMSPFTSEGSSDVRKERSTLAAPASPIHRASTDRDGAEPRRHPTFPAGVTRSATAAAPEGSSSGDRGPMRGPSVAITSVEVPSRDAPSIAPASAVSPASGLPNTSRALAGSTPSASATKAPAPAGPDVAYARTSTLGFRAAARARPPASTAIVTSSSSNAGTDRSSIVSAATPPTFVPRASALIRWRGM